MACQIDPNAFDFYSTSPIFKEISFYALFS